jgi:hypothetical protein
VKINITQSIGHGQEDWPKRSHPGYVVITVNGVSEIIEHKKMEPLFYISNKEAVQRTIAEKHTSKRTDELEKVK